MLRSPFLCRGLALRAHSNRQVKRIFGKPPPKGGPAPRPEVAPPAYADKDAIPFHVRPFPRAARPERMMRAELPLLRPSAGGVDACALTGGPAPPGDRLSPPLQVRRVSRSNQLPVYRGALAAWSGRCRAAARAGSCGAEQGPVAAHLRDCAPDYRNGNTRVLTQVRRVDGDIEVRPPGPASPSRPSATPAPDMRSARVPPPRAGAGVRFVRGVRRRAGDSAARPRRFGGQPQGRCAAAPGHAGVLSGFPPAQAGAAVGQRGDRLP